MSETAHFKLPYLQAAQAQKHVTMNDALGRMDGFAAARLESVGQSAPPAGTGDGSLHAVGSAPSGAWAGQAGRLALMLNGGWVFLDPEMGQRAWDVNAGAEMMHDGVDWLPDAVAVAANGAATCTRILTETHDLSAGASSVTSALIPSHAQVLAVTARVTGAITGTGLTGWQLGVSGAEDRYGSGLGVALGSYAKGVTGTPVVYYADTALVLTAEGGSFAAGQVEIAVHITEVVVPRAI